MDKVKEFYDTDQLKHAYPVSGSLDALNHLREMGYSLTIVTARSILCELDSTIIWVDKHFNGNFI
jgi:phosphoglycolate phosphatase-like HAD superfamily hydrolase